MVAGALAIAVASVAGFPAGVLAAAEAPSVSAASGILIDRSTGKVLWSKAPDLRLAPASCTKIMTALLVLERYRDLSRYACAPGSVTNYQKVAIGLRPGDRITLRQALRGLMVKSANDAAITLAAAVSGGEQALVRQMNSRARQLGLTHTHYLNCRGTPEPGHYSSARDLARLGRYAMRDQRFRALVGTSTAVVRWPPSHAVTVTSHNRLLDYSWGDGIKTGATAQSKMVLVGSGKPQGVPLIVVTMREPTRDQEEKDAVALMQWGAAQLTRGATSSTR
jgi:serine-type D-Ala-D-Ala carboxypeptidase (penicillin-binding protein 5/6)